MTVSSTTTKSSHSGNGSLDTFAYAFKIFADDDLVVIIRTNSTGAEATKTKTTHYTVTGVGSASGGNVVFTSGNIPTSGETVVIKRSLTLTQSTDYVANDPFPADSHEDALDRLTMIAQQQQEVFDRAVVLPETDTASTTIPSSTARANKYLSFDSNGDFTVTSQTSDAAVEVVEDTTPQLGGNHDVNTKNIVFGDSGSASDDRLTFGAGTDVSVYWDGTDGHITALGTLNIDGADGHELAKFVDGGAVELYHNDSKKIETTSTGVTVTGDILVSDAAPNLELKDTDTNRFVDILYGTRVATFRNTMASSEDIDTVEPSFVFSFKDDGETRTAVTIGDDGTTTFTSGDAGTVIARVGTNVAGIKTASGDDFCVGTDAYNQAIRIKNDSGQVRINTSVAFNNNMSITPCVHIDINDNSNTPNGGIAIGGIMSGETAFSTMAGASVDYNAAIFANGGATTVGTISCTTAATTYSTASDYRLKENVIDMTGAIDRVKQLAPKRFNFIAEPSKTVDGFLAHEAQAVVPESVIGTKDAVDDDGKPIIQGIDQAKLVPLLIGALKESIAKIETLETKVAALEAG